MVGRNLIFAAIALLSTAGGVAVAQSSLDRSALAMTIGKMMGFSPEGSKLWAAHAIAGSDQARYGRSTRLHRALGEQLALDRPNRAVLRRLTSEIVAEQGRLERIEQDRLLNIAFRLSDADRKSLGRFMVRAAPGNLPGSKAILQQVP